ncbi:SufE family protein [Nisaea acidiphila]|uniref:SufE family protein n=1 Tax=Nisaea acidiphila TaxID=1862145 RepID=A0A9J7APA3_9PROT|nr:SufE family protein [Nisaea acidiphila]UUX48425.1 SufE family protein [Nisaea acidiphila]
MVAETDLAAPERSIAEEQEELISEFAFFDDWMDRYQYLIDLGRKLPELPEEFKRDEFKLKGCQSQVWLVGERHGDRLLFRAISDAAIVSGLIAVILRIYSNRTAEEILATEPDFIRDIGLEEHLSPTRKNGLGAMLNKIKAEAQAAAGG